MALPRERRYHFVFKLPLVVSLEGVSIPKAKFIEDNRGLIMVSSMAIFMHRERLPIYNVEFCIDQNDYRLLEWRRLPLPSLTRTCHMYHQPTASDKREAQHLLVDAWREECAAPAALRSPARSPAAPRARARPTALPPAPPRSPASARSPCGC